MREFESLKPAGLTDSFHAEIYGEEPIVGVEESGERVVLSYTFPGFYLSDDSQYVDGERVTFKQINIAKAGFLSESGKPLLPSFGRYVQIPFKCDHRITVVKGECVQFDDILVLPAQEELTDDPEDQHVLEYDAEFYSQDKLYPGDVVKVTGPFEIDGYNALLVHVRPLQYNPAKRRLMGFGNVAVTVALSPKGARWVDGYPLIDSALNREAFGNFFVNPRRKIEERLDIDPGSVPVGSMLYRGPEFLIIYHDAFKAAAEKLAEWKNMRGLRSETVSIGTVGNTVGQIKTYIRSKRKPPFSRLRYVLLFGDVDVIESETVPGGMDPNVTDYYYSTWRDSIGAIDIVMPWLSIGRIPVRTAEEGMAVVDQIINYEKNPPPDPEYYRRMVFGAYFQDHERMGTPDSIACRCYMKTMEAIREHMTILGFDVERVYVSQYPDVKFYKDHTPVPDEVKNSITDADTATDRLIFTTAEGQLITAHRDHGSPSGWAHPLFVKSHLDGITSEQPTMLYSVNCQTGRFDLTSPTESFAETILRMKGGSPSLIAATRNSGTFRNDSMMKALFDAMWPGVLPTFPDSTAGYAMKNNRLGDILNYAKSYLPVAHSNPIGVKDHLEIYHVIGDPTMELWKAVPRIIGMGLVAGRTYLYIILSDCPKGSVITIWRGDKMLKRIEPSSRYIRVSLRDIAASALPPMRRRISVCFWAPGYRFRRSNVRV